MLGVGGLPAPLLYSVAMPIATKEMEPDIAVVAVSGRLVLGKDVERLEETTNLLLENGKRKFVFDLTALDYADSAGIGTLVSCLTAIRKAGGELRMAGVNPRIQRLFKMTGVDRLMSLYPTVADAAAAG
jgi:anti-sigma B factor antagonist